MTSLKETLDLAAMQAVEAMAGYGAVHRDTDWPWDNWIVEGEHVGRGHVERYDHGKLTVLHVAILPPSGSSRPIFGADLVGTDKGVSLMAWDWSPTSPHGPVPPSLPPLCGRMRRLPEWADRIMSTHAVAIRPEEDEDVRTFLMFSLASLRDYLDTRLGYGDPESAIRRYAMAQRSNPSLRGALAKHLGEYAADRYIREVLWPTPDSIWPAEQGA